MQILGNIHKNEHYKLFNSNNLDMSVRNEFMMTNFNVEKKLHKQPCSNPNNREIICLMIVYHV